MIDFNIELIANIIAVAMFIIAAFAGTKWKQAKAILHDIRLLVVSIDDAFEDDTVSDDEVRLVIRRLKRLCDLDVLSTPSK